MKKLFKKTLKLLGSRLVYLFVGLSFAVAIIVVQAAIGSVAVTPGTKLTATSWNTMINDLNSLDGRMATIEGAGASLGQNGCHWIYEDDSCGHSCGLNVTHSATCPVGEYVAGHRNTSWNEWGRYDLQILCCAP